MNSPEKASHQVLGTLAEEEIKTFLTECVNLPDHMHGTIVPVRGTPYANWTDESPQFDRWLRRWQRLFTFQSEGEDGKWKAVEIPPDQLKAFAPKVRLALRRIWIEQDARQRDWYFYRLRDSYHRMIVRAENPHLLDITDRRALELFEDTSRARGDNASQKARFLESWTGADILEDVPRICPFEAAVYWLQVNQRLMLHCGGAVCAAPYFFRAEKGQRFCSPECADPARRESKLRWWNENRRATAKKKARKSLR